MRETAGIVKFTSSRGGNPFKGRNFMVTPDARVATAKRRLRALLKKFRGRKVVVLGDVMLDEYVWGRAERISPEAPVPVVEVERRTFGPGGAANVAANLASFGAEVFVAGVVGEDKASENLRRALEERKIDPSGLVSDSSRPTTVKTRVIAHDQQVVRVDEESREPVSEEVCRKLFSALRRGLEGAEALVISDYAKGVATPELVSGAIALAKARRALVTSGPKPKNLRLFRGCFLVCLNERETLEAMALEGMSQGGLPEGDEWTLGVPDLMGRLGLERVVITRGAKGMLAYHGKSGFSVPALKVEVYDVAGAGDTVLSVLTLALASEGSLREAVELANLAGASVVRKVGVATTTAEEIEGLMDGWRPTAI